MKKYLCVLSIFAACLVQGHASSESKFSVVANTATTVSVPANRHAYIQYTVTNNTTVTRTLTAAPIPNVTQITADSSQCSNPFVLAAGGSCKLTYYVDGSLLTSSYSGGPVVCKTKSGSNTPDPYLCSQPEPSMYLSVSPAPAVSTLTNKMYVSNWDGNSISLCYLQSGVPAFCQVSAVSNTFVKPEALAINGNFIFVANIGGGISSCAIDPVSGELTACVNAIPSPTDQLSIHAPTGISFSAGKAYIANSGPAQFNQGITECSVAGSILSGCSFTQGNASFSVPSDLAIFGGTVYVSNFNSQTVETTYCQLGGALCVAGLVGNVGASSLLNNPEGITFATINAANYVYFTNHGNHTVAFCQVASPSSFTNCAITGGYFTGFGNLAILSSESKAYIPSGLKTVAVCSVGSNGSLSSCVDSSEVGFNNPSGIIIQ